MNKIILQSMKKHLRSLLLTCTTFNSKCTIIIKSYQPSNSMKSYVQQNLQTPTPDNPKFNLLDASGEINPARKPRQQSRSSGHGQKMQRLTTFLMIGVGGGFAAIRARRARRDKTRRKLGERPGQLRGTAADQTSY